MTNLRSIDVSNVGSHVFEAIEAAIVEGELSPGTPLRDRYLARVLNVSRTPVREALQRLESSGFTERRGRTGWYVASFTPQDIRNLFELRRMIEPVGLERLSTTWEKETVEELSSFFDEFPDRLPPSLFVDYIQRDHQFHRRIVQCSENDWAVYFYSVVSRHIERFRHHLASWYAERMTEVVKEHLQICEAIAAHEFSAATTALLHQLHMGERAMLELVQEQQSEQLAERYPFVTNDAQAHIRGATENNIEAFHDSEK